MTTERRPRSLNGSAVRTRVLPATAAGISALLYLLYVFHYSVDVPVADDWNVIPLASDAVHRDVGLVDLWSQYGNTRLFVVRLFFSAFGVLDHLNFRHIILFSAGTYVASFVILLALFRSYLRRPLTFLSVLSLGVVWFSVADYTNALWGFQLAWYLVVLFFVAMAYFLLIPHHHRNLFFALGIVAAVLASLTIVQGFLVWAPGLICLLWASPWGRRTYYESAIWISAAVATTAIYLHNYDFASGPVICQIQGGSAAGCSLSYGLTHPVLLARFLSILAGNVVPTLPGTYVRLHELLGAAIWIAAGFVVVQSIRERRLATNPLPVLLIVFALQFDVMIATGRLGLGVTGAGKNWYTMPNIILLSGIAIYAWRHVPDLRRARNGLTPVTPLRLVGFVTLTAFLVTQVVVATQFGVANGRAFRATNVNNARVLANLAEIRDGKRDCYLASVVTGPRLSEIYSAFAIARQDQLTLFQGGSADRYRAQGPPILRQCG